MSDANRFYITTAIDYPNSRPHIGTAFEKIGADVQARFQRMEGRSVHFLMGNDENTVKVSQRAEALGLEPKPYVDDMARQFQDVWKAIEISNDDFIQTSEERHHVGCRKFIQAVYDAGDIYKKAYVGQYCDGCEEFKTERDPANGRCPNHPNQPLRQVEEENYFFRLSAFADRLLAHYEANPHFIQPASRRNEIISLVKSGLQDVSISRRGFTWGIKVPFDEEQTIYVWFDALLNYITAIGYGTDEARFHSLWPADVHVIGKDITRFHCALWPAMLMSAGLPLPRQVFGHGFVFRKDESTGELQKMSKSLGNAVEPMEIVAQVLIGRISFLLHEPVPVRRRRRVLVRAVHRPLQREPRQQPRQSLQPGALDVPQVLRRPSRRRFLREYLTVAPGARPGGAGERTTSLDETAFDYNVAIQRIWLEVLDAVNRYIQETQPFKLAKTDLDACKTVLLNLAEALRRDLDPHQTLPAEHRRDLLPGLQLRRGPGLGPGWLC